MLSNCLRAIISKSILQPHLSWHPEELKDKSAPDFDERLTMNEIWKAGEGILAAVMSSYIIRSDLPQLQQAVVMMRTVAG